jgi:hypothetical protein
VRVDWLIPAEFVSITNGSVTIVGGGFDTVFIENFPGPVAINLAFRASGLPDTGNHELTLQVHNPSMEDALDPLTFPFEMLAPPGARPGWEVTVMAPLQVIFEATVEGPYTITATVDGGNSTSISLYLTPRPPA